MRIRIDMRIFLLLLVFALTKQIGSYSIIMLFAIIHEIGHLTAGLLVGMKPEKIEIKPYGMALYFKLLINDYNKKIGNGNLLEIKKIIVALAGPIVNLICIMAAFKLNINVFLNLLIIYSNLILIIINLIPMYPLDGGRIVKSLLHIKFGKRKSEKYINTISFVALIILTIFSSILVFIYHNIAIIFIVFVLWFMYLKEDILYRRRNKIYELLEKSVEF